uniref:Uncharacterized protein n=1 Tax=Vitis vinifera TaxID=29760 RepID=F6HBK8_VITVI
MWRSTTRRKERKEREEREKERILLIVTGGKMGNFNDGQYEAAAQLHSQAQQISVVLYPKDATESGKLL